MQEAFDDVIKAREDEERVKNEAESYANGIVRARGRAQRMKEEAEAYRQQVIAKATGEAQRFVNISEYERLRPANVYISMHSNQYSLTPTRSWSMLRAVIT